MTITIPLQDYRDQFEPVLLKSNVLELSDLHEGEELQGTVRNVVDFGAFVDIGLHEDGLVAYFENAPAARDTSKRCRIRR